MKLRSAQFVLLVLLFTSLPLSEVSSLRLAGEIAGASTATGAGFATRAQQETEAAAGSSRTLRSRARRTAAARAVWSMRAPAAQAAALEAVTSYPAHAAA